MKREMMYMFSNKNVCTIFAVPLLFVAHCSDTLPSTLKYSPPVVFSGYINGEFYNLTGNLYWQNRCMQVADTLRMYFYSSNFHEDNKIRVGDLLRLDIYPGVGAVIGTGRVLFHMARYQERNTSYTVSRKDTLNSQNIVQIQIQALGSGSAQQILLDKIYIRSSPEWGTTGNLLEIKDGRIEGVIE